MRALKDPFPPARQAGILAMAATQNFYHMNELASRLLPSLCSMTRDPEKIVRDQVSLAFCLLSNMQTQTHTHTHTHAHIYLKVYMCVCVCGACIGSDVD